MTQPNWIDAMPADDLPNDDVIGVEVAGRDIAIYRIGEELYATDNTCTHGQARLCVGFLEGYEIECPLHQGRFDVRDGKPTCAPASVALRSYPIKIDVDRVFVCVDEP